MQDDESIGFQRTRKERVYWIKINEDTVEETDGLTLTLVTLFRMLGLATITSQFINYWRDSSCWKEVYSLRMEITIRLEPHDLSRNLFYGICDLTFSPVCNL